MKALLLVLLVVLLFSFNILSAFAYEEQKTMFSKEGIYQSLSVNYSLNKDMSCRNKNFRSMARTVFNYLKVHGRGARYAPFDCNGKVVEFVNNGSDVLDVYVRDK